MANATLCRRTGALSPLKSKLKKAKLRWSQKENSLKLRKSTYIDRLNFF